MLPDSLMDMWMFRVSLFFLVFFELFSNWKLFCFCYRVEAWQWLVVWNKKLVFDLMKKKIRIHCLTQILFLSPPFPGTSSSCCCCCRCCCLRRRGREGGINADLFGVRSKQWCTNKAHNKKNPHFVISLSLYSVDHWRSSKQGADCPILSFLSGRSFMESVCQTFKIFRSHFSLIHFVYIPYTWPGYFFCAEILSC